QSAGAGSTSRSWGLVVARSIVRGFIVLQTVARNCTAIQRDGVAIDGAERARWAMYSFSARSETVVRRRSYKVPTERDLVSARLENAGFTRE
ncbi:hypothetical protein B0H13DRAFT_2052979, partial [Mycena leptocephala]